MALPQSVRNLAAAGFSPIEDIMLAILRAGLPDVLSVAEIPDPSTAPQILVRRGHSMGDWSGDPRFFDSARVDISTFTEDETGEEGSEVQGSILQEAIRQVLKSAWLDHWRQDGLGSIIKIEMTDEPSREADWATSSGPVQYADLPTNWVRQESGYKVLVRKPRQ